MNGWRWISGSVIHPLVRTVEKHGEDRQLNIQKKKQYFFLNALMVCFLTLALLGGCATRTPQHISEAKALRDLGEAYFLQGSYSRALNEFLRAERLNPDDPYLQNNLGLTYLNLEKADMAIAHFKKAIMLRQDYGPAQNNLATAHITQENWQAAIDVLTPLTEDLLYATPHYAFSNMGWACYNLKNYDDALRAYTRALRLEPHHPAALRGQSMTLMAMGRFEKALQAITRLLDVMPLDAGGWMLKGEILEKLNRTQEARQAYEQAKITGQDTDIEQEAEITLRRLSL